MPKYMIHATYTVEGTKGLLKEGGTARRAAIEKAAESLGGKVEAAYYAFGDADVYVVVDLPNNASMTALSLTANATGTVVAKTTVLMSPAEIDEAVKLHPAYRAPGQ